jgi:hypothetical protein
LRAKHDIQGNYRSETPACHRCGLPLLADSEYCPFCERYLSEGAMARLLGGRGARRLAPGERRILGIPEHTLLAVGVVVLAAIAVASLVVAVTS